MNIDERSNYEISQLINYIKQVYKSDAKDSKKIFRKQLFSILSEYASNPQVERRVFEKFLSILYTEPMNERTRRSIFSLLRDFVEPSSNLIDGFLNFLHYANSQKNSKLAVDLNKILEGRSSDDRNYSEEWNWKNLSDPSLIQLLKERTYCSGDFDKPIFTALFQYVSPQELAQTSLMEIKISSTFKNLPQAARDHYADALLIHCKSNFKNLFNRILSDYESKKALIPSVFRIRNDYQIVDDCFKVAPENIGEYSNNLEYIFTRCLNLVSFPEVFAASCLRGGKENLFSDPFLSNIIKKLSLNSYNGPFPYTQFLSIQRYVDYIDLKTFFAMSEKCQISQAIVVQKFNQIPKTKEKYLEALRLLCSTPSKTWTNMNRFYHLLFGKKQIKTSENSDGSQNSPETIELDKNMFERLLILKSEENMSGIAHFLTKAIHDGYYLENILTPFVMRTFIDEAMNGNDDCLNFISEALLLSGENNPMFLFWINEHICDEFADLLDQNPILSHSFEPFFRKLLNSKNDDLKEMILSVFHDSKFGSFN